MNNRIQFICEKEGVTLAEDSLVTLSMVSGGDLRRAITTLQSAVRLGGKTVERCVESLEQLGPQRSGSNSKSEWLQANHLGRVRAGAPRGHRQPACCVQGARISGVAGQGEPAA
jgi:DNA polymerase III delta prime subunit